MRMNGSAEYLNELPLLSITGLEAVIQSGWQGQALPWRECQPQFRSRFSLPPC